MRNLIVILGPTSSGKSALGVQLAKKFRGVVISADSRQVYRGMDIGTAKITKREMRGVPHFLLNVASPKNQYSVADYANQVGKVLRHTPESTPVFLVGGSPFYIKAIIEPGSFSSVKPNPALRQRLEKKTTPQLLTLLRRKDPKRAQTIDRANRRRIIRAIEIALSPAPPVSGRAVRRTEGVGAMRVLKIGLRVPRQKLYQKIDRRVDARMKYGMVAEVRKLRRAGLSWKRLDSFGLEYRWVSRYLQGQISQPEMVERLKGDIHDFVRRQETWWRKEKHIRWITDRRKAGPLVKRFLQP